MFEHRSTRTIGGGLLTGATALLFILAVSHAAAAPTGAFGEGQKVEVREGDVWSAGSVLKKEGRRYLVHYENADASADEWVTADRLRLSSGATPATAPTPAKPAVTTFSVGDALECKSGSTCKVTLTNKNGKWFLITFEDHFRGWREWVEPWRLRKRGSSEDNLGFVQPNAAILPNARIPQPPTDDPADAPQPNGTATEKTDTRSEAFAPSTPINTSAMIEIAVGNPAPDRFVLDPEVAQKISPSPIVLSGAKLDFFERLQPLIVSPTSVTAVVAYLKAPPGERYTSRVQRLDLRAGSILNACKLPVGIVACDLSPDGKTLLAHSTAFGFGLDDRLDLWDITSAEAKHLISFKPYGGGEHRERDILWARFIDSTHVLTTNHDGNLIAWDTKGAAVWSLKIAWESQPALSANKKQLAVSLDKAIAVLEPLTGQSLLSIETPALRGGHLSFSPDGSKLAVTGLTSLSIWDLPSGHLAHDIYVPGSRGESIHWADGFVLLDGSRLVNLDAEVTVRDYDRSAANFDECTGSFAGRFFYTSTSHVQSTSPILASIVLPEAATKTAAVKPPDIAIQPGVKISVEANVPADIQEAVLTALKSKATANGLIVENNQPIRLIASTEQGKPQEMSYSDMMGPHFGPSAKPTTKMNVNSVILKVAITDAENKSLWSNSSTISPPSFLHLQNGESIDAAVAKAMTPKAGFFQAVRIPKRIPKPGATPPVSDLTPRGTATERPDRAG